MFLHANDILRPIACDEREIAFASPVYKYNMHEGADYTSRKNRSKSKILKKDMYLTRHGFQKMSRRLLIIARWFIFSICFVLLLITGRKRRNQEPAENDYEEGKKSPTCLY